MISRLQAPMVCSSARGVWGHAPPEQICKNGANLMDSGEVFGD